jgi:hypothetical protein
MQELDPTLNPESWEPCFSPRSRRAETLRATKAGETDSAACVLGFGDILCADRAFGCAVIDALLQERLGALVTLAYCGADFRGIEAWMHKARVVHVALGAYLARSQARVLCVDWAGLGPVLVSGGGLEVFRRSFGQALVRLDMIGAAPDRVVFHVGRTLRESGFGMSSQALRAAGETARSIRRDLAKAGLAPGPHGQESRLYRSILLGRTY